MDIVEKLKGAAKMMAKYKAASFEQADLERAAAEITRLRAELAEARKSAYAKGAEDMRERVASWHDGRFIETPDAFEMDFHKSAAAAIRALPIEGEKRLAVPSDHQSTKP